MKKRIRKQLTKAQLASIMADWFDRDGKTFVKIPSEARKKWIKNMGTKSVYSEYILKSPTVKQLFRRAYSLAKDTLIAMMLPVKVRLIVGKQQSCTDGVNLVVDTRCFDDKDLTPGEKLDVFLGFTVHEGLHIKHTDFAAVKTRNRVLHTIYNILEDERIEELNGQEFPGFSLFIEKTKYWVFNKQYKEQKIDVSKLGPAEKVLLLFTRIIRYPTMLEEKDVRSVGGYLLKIKEVLQPYPTSTQEVFEAAKKIYEIIKDLIAEDKKMMENNILPDDVDENGEPVEITITDADMEAIEKELENPAAGSMLAKLLIFLNAVAKPHQENDSSEEKTAEFIKNDQELINELEGRVERPENKNVFIEKQEEINASKDVYNRVVKEINPYVSSVRKQLMGHSKEHKLIHKSMRSGVLDTAKLAEARQGVQTVYQREGMVKADKINLVLLIDESGSMNGDKAKQAQKAAILIKEALKGLPNVNLYIYGHTAGEHGAGVTDLLVYYEPRHTPKYSLAGVTGRNVNRDGEAITFAAERVRKFSQEKTIMFVISDGYPSYRECSVYEGMALTRTAVEKLQRKGWSIIQIAIENDFDPKKMFDHFLKLTNMRTLATDLGKVVKKAVEKFSTIRVS